MAPPSPPIAGPPAVEVAELCFAYADGDTVLDTVSFSVAQGDFLAIIGPNGGGKTTLLNLMLGLRKPERGSIRIFGVAPERMSSRIGYVPQFSTMRTDFPASVLELVLMGGACPNARAGGWTTDAKAEERALAYLDILGLGGCAGLRVGTLSGGQRQRALVARALMGRPATVAEEISAQPHPVPFLLLLDEPTASIDPEGKFCFYEFIGKLRGLVTVIVVSHDLFMVSPFFSRVVFVNKELTALEGNMLSPDNMNTLFGRHMHDCPVGDMQHAGGAMHYSGCSHPACRQEELGPDGDACDACASDECNCQGRGKTPERENA